jgi:hypothetical protein
MICPLADRLVRLEPLLSFCGPDRSCPLALIAFEFFGNPDQRAKHRGGVIAGQLHDTGFDDEAAEFDEMSRALAAFDLPRPHVMSRPCGLIPVARRSVALERRPCCGQLLAHFAAPGFERTRPRAWPISEKLISTRSDELRKLDALAKAVLSPVSGLGHINPMRWIRKRNLRNLMAAKEIASDQEGVQAFANAIDLEMGLRPLRLKLVDYVMALFNRAPDSKLPSSPAKPWTSRKIEVAMASPQLPSSS